MKSRNEGRTPGLINAELARQVRWLHATNPAPVAPLASLRERRLRYAAERRRFVWTMVAFAAVGAMVVIGAVLIMRPDESEWAMPATLLWLAALMPVYVALRPVVPTQQDVERDIELRREVGMSETVSSDGDQPIP
jgi:type VI protein secretion system component VasF